MRGVLHKESLAGGHCWIVGAFSDTDANRRALWSGEDSVMCAAGRAPRWRGQEGPYYGRVQCEEKSEVSPVCCCREQRPVLTDHQGVRKSVEAFTYSELGAALDTNPRGHGVCGLQWHVCSYAEVTVQGAMRGATLVDATRMVLSLSPAMYSCRPCLRCGASVDRGPKLHP